MNSKISTKMEERDEQEIKFRCHLKTHRAETKCQSQDVEFHVKRAHE